MKVKRFTAPNMQQALRKVSQEMGADAVIMSSKKVGQAFEVVAALDYQAGQEKNTQEVERQLTLQQELESSRLQEQLSRSRLMQHSSVQTEDNTLAEPRYPGRSLSNSPSETAHSLNPQALNAVSDELKTLKDWLVSHHGSAWDTRRPMTWQQSQMWQRCQDVGLEPAWADRITSRVPGDVDVEKSWQQVLTFIADDLPIARGDILQKGGHYALVGPTGAGKTTTIGKLAAQYVLKHGPDSVALITLDHYRVAAHDQINTFARILNVDLHKVRSTQELQEALLKTRDKSLVLIDSAGLASQDPHFQPQLSILKKARAAIKLKTLLVLPLTSQGRCLQENYEHFKAAGLAGCVFSKLDECFSLGPAMSVAALTRLPVSLITDGPHIPDDVHYPDAHKLVSLAEQMARMARTRWQAAEAMKTTTEPRFQHGV